MSSERALLRRGGPLLRPIIAVDEASDVPDPAGRMLSERSQSPIAEDMKGITVLADGTSVLARVKTKIQADDGTSKDRLQKKTFRGPSLDRNLEKARAWRSRIRGEQAIRDLPEGIRRAKRTNGYALVATVATWADEKRPSRTFAEDDLEAAVAWLARANEARSAGLPLPEPDSSAAPSRQTQAPTQDVLLGVAVREWLDSFYGEKLAAGKTQPTNVRTITRLSENFIVDVIGSYRLNDITTKEHLVPLVEGMAKRGFSTGQQRRVIWVLNSTFLYANSVGWTNRNPAHLLQAREPISAEEVAKISGNVSKGRGKNTRTRPPAHPKKMAMLLGRIRATYGDEFALAVALQRYMGLRLSESLGPTIADVDRFRRQLKVTKQRGHRFEKLDETGCRVISTRSENTKSRAGTRVLPIPDFLWGEVEAQLDRRIAAGAQSADPLILCEGEPEEFLGMAIREAVKKHSQGLLRRNTGEEGEYLPHDFRHQYESDLFNAGVPDLLQSYLLGHSLNRKSDAAAVTVKTYLHDYQESEWERDDETLTDFDLTLRDAAEQVNTHVLRALDGTPLISPRDEAFAVTSSSAQASNAEEWLTLAEAAELLGVTPSRVYQMVSRGQLTVAITDPVTGHPYRVGTSRRPVKVVPASEVSAATLGQVPLIEVARLLAGELGQTLDADRVAGFAEDAGIAYESLNGHTRVIAAGDLDRLCEVIRTWFEFKKSHWAAYTAASELGVAVGLIQRSADRGLLTPVETPVAFRSGRAQQWFRQQDVVEAVWNLLPKAKRAKFARRCAELGLSTPATSQVA